MNDEATGERASPQTFWEFLRVADLLRAALFGLGLSETELAVSS
jgi:hypothetical protein